jgi:hypothetical protein
LELLEELFKFFEVFGELLKVLKVFLKLPTRFKKFGEVLRLF